MANGDIERRRATPVSFSSGAKVALAGLILTLVLNGGALIWGAATINAAVQYGARERAQIVSQLYTISNTLNTLENRMTAVEVKLDEHDSRERGHP